MLEELERKHVRRVAEIHASSWSQNEISVKLGLRYIRLFYESIVESPHSFGYVSTEKEGVVAYAVGFFDYQEFNREFRNKILFHFLLILIAGMLSGRLLLADVINLLDDNKKLRNARFPKYHLGALALANEYKRTGPGKTAITESVAAILDELRKRGCPGCWGLGDKKNTALRRLLLDTGFEGMDEIPLRGKSVVLYEKTLE